MLPHHPTWAADILSPQYFSYRQRAVIHADPRYLDDIHIYMKSDPLRYAYCTVGHLLKPSTLQQTWEETDSSVVRFRNNYP